jgi:hypothetical protein
VLALAPAAAASPLAAPADLRLVNYYPAQNGWAYMWQRWNPAAIDRDFARVRWLNGNTVRVIVQAGTFGFPTPSPVYLDRLRRVVALADARDLRVELTLFDWWGSYDRLAGSRRWARAVLGPYAGDERIAAVELKNEVDPDDPAAAAWTRAMLPYLRGLAGGIPVTVSVTGEDLGARLRELEAELGNVRPDFWTVHYYDKPELAYRTLAEAQAAAAPLPLFVGETGYFDSDSDPGVHLAADRDDEQVRYLRSLAAAAGLLGLPPPAPWILSDFSRRATSRRLPAAEYHFGLFRTNGTPKPAAAAVRAIFAGTAPDLTFDGGFEELEPGLTRPEPALWRRRGAADVVLDAATAHGGTASLEVGSIRGFATAHALVWTQPPAPWVTPGQSVHLSAWARGEDVSGENGISLAWYDGARHLVGRSDSAGLAPGTSDWTELDVDGVAPPGAAYIRIELSSDGDTGRAWFDDVALATG